MTIRARGKTFQVDVLHEGKRIRKTAKTKEEARKLEKELTARLLAGEFDEVKKSDEKTLHDLYMITKSLYWKNTKGSKSACLNTELVLEELGRTTPISEVTGEDIAQMIFAFENKGNSDSTINRKLSALSKLFSVAVEREYIVKAPKLPFRKEPQHRIRWVTEDEEVKILTFLTHMGLVDFRDFVIVAIDTGFREGELMKLELKDYADGMIHIWESKNGYPRSVPVTDRVRAIVEDRIARGYTKLFQNLTMHDLRFSWKHVRKHMKLVDDVQFVIHALRHTCASRLVQRGIPLAVIQKWMGHRNIQTTLRYAHLAPENLNAAMLVLNNPAGGSTLPSKAVSQA